MGIGTLWRLNDLVDDELNYLGEEAKTVWANDWGCQTDAPPVEKDGGSGTRGGHWDDACLRDELMTGYLGGGDGPRPISKLTIASLEDIGYQVNYTAAEEYDGFDTTCCFPTESSLPPPNESLSEEGLDAAIAFGQQILQESAGPEQELDDGLIYVGDAMVTVLFEEGGNIYDVHVTSESF